MTIVVYQFSWICYLYNQGRGTRDEELCSYAVLRFTLAN
jgi:hypothetical protein